MTSPEPSVIIFAIGRGEYDQQLSKIAAAIQSRRRNCEGVGYISPSIGDTVELFDDISIEELRGAKLKVLGILPNNRLRAQFLDTYGEYQRGKIVKISRDAVYRVHYYA